MLQMLSQKSKQIAKPSVEELETDAIWYDLMNPEPAEIAAIERVLNIKIPALTEMKEIEESSRLYEGEGILYMTALLVASADSEHPFTVPVTFIITRSNFVTVRYDDLKAFQLFSKKIVKNGFINPQTVFCGLIDTIVERTADILEMNSTEVDCISNEIFKRKTRTNSMEMKEILVHIGKTGELNSKIRECLMTFDRLLIFYTNQIAEKGDKRHLLKISTVQLDVKSLVNYVSFLFGKIEFLLDATLGFIDIEQNGIIKFFSVAAVIFLPPMVIASIYGMNFPTMPELKWIWGYPFALILMLVSAVLPYLYFKKKGWL
jgi:magnesium transporter